jgi:hypothetical protein
MSEEEEYVYEVWWNGVNDGRDSDLLRRDLRQPEKRLAEREVPRPTARAAVLAALPASAHDAVTFRELIVLTGCTPDAVNSALYVLRVAGALASEPIPSEPARRARPPQRYWRIA